MKRQGLGGTIIRGILIGGLMAGFVGGLWLANNCYMGRLDPDIYPNRSLFTLGFMFLLGFVFAAVPGIVLGIIGSLVVVFVPRRKQPAQISATVPSQNNWPPAPKSKEEIDNSNTT